MYKLVLAPISGIVVCIKRVTDNASIPLDQSNSDYQRYLKWLDGYEETPDGWVKTSDGNTPLPADQE